MRSSEALALAFDLGTTTIAASLLNPETGERLASAVRLNPQRSYGADVVTRLAAALRSPDAAGSMRSLANGELDSMAAELADTAGVAPDALISAAVAGNSVMEHLLLGLPVNSLAYPPYRPLSPAGCTLRTRDLGWAMDMTCRTFPMPGGYVGGDLVAFLFGAAGGETPCLYLDLGTNGEIALAEGERLFATSAAAGPAFEGGNLACGMVALPGAIDRVFLDKGRLQMTTISGCAPAGLCGSGAIAALSLLLEQGVVDETGRLLAPAEISSNLANHIREMHGEPSFVLYRDAKSSIYLSQNDIRQIQLAKSAICTGIEVLLSHAGLKRTDLKQVVLTGSFGAVLLPQDLKNIGIFDENMVKISRFVHEGALRGVEAATLAADDFASLDRLSEAITVIPLSGTPAFEKNFFTYMNFPKH
ncbi:ASKHA domain-containing protein [Geotalea sp. SG265]|uniref:ASKHA domain-containing protein n=1 Tax=Geotalea sp. SG265 TaxID=2922867 RepID=UPI001FAF8DF7|nr:ASKHA domain-containing protein [Geotalea sp. SG265]